MKVAQLILLIAVILFHVTEGRLVEENAEEALRGLKTRSRWPELLHTDGEAAKKAILAEYPKLDVQIVFIRDVVSGDYRRNRVRIRVNKTDTVVRIPKIG